MNALSFTFGMCCVLLLSLRLQAQAAPSSEPLLLSAETFIESIQHDSVLLIDVRTQTEYRRGHLPNAIKVDFLQPTEFYEFFEKIDPTEPIYLYCQGGMRSSKAATYLKNRGFKHIFELKDGLVGLEEYLSKD